MKKVHLVIDVARCHGCTACVLSCGDEHLGKDHAPIALPKSDQSQRWIDILHLERGQYPLQDMCNLPRPCMHCEAAPCMAAGPEGAVHRRSDGIVIIDPLKAAGHRELMEACPYGAIHWNEELRVPQKCTLCAHLLDQGWSQPRCTQACPTGALEFAFLEESDMLLRVVAEELEVFHPEFGTRPRIWYRNLHRFTKCHIAGSVARDYGLECAVGAEVSITHLASGNTWSARTNNYGNFKVDGLDPESGTYRVEVRLRGLSRSCDVDLRDSLNLGVLHL
nr:4Fe-4S dicluster domain-containing protein [uncultured Holophaga sp.]